MSRERVGRESEEVFWGCERRQEDHTGSTSFGFLDACPLYVRAHSDTAPRHARFSSLHLQWSADSIYRQLLPFYRQGVVVGLLRSGIYLFSAARVCREALRAHLETFIQELQI